MDIENSRNKTIAKEVREELGNLSVIFWQDQYFVENYEVDISFVEKNKYRDYYHGYTLLEFPYWFLDFRHAYNTQFRNRYRTSKSSGSVKTAWYGEPFDENKFTYSSLSNYEINFPIKAFERFPNLKLILEFYMDVGLYEEGPADYERIRIETITDEKQMKRGNNTLEYLTKTGNVSVTRKYETKGLRKIILKLERKLDKELVDKSIVMRNTGFQLTWYFEDGNGNTSNFELKEYKPNQDYKKKNNNQQFVYFVSLVNEVLYYQNISLDTLWDTARRYRLDYIQRKLDGKGLACKEKDVTNTKDYFDYIPSDLTFTPNKGNLLRSVLCVTM